MCGGGVGSLALMTKLHDTVELLAFRISSIYAQTGLLDADTPTAALGVGTVVRHGLGRLEGTMEGFKRSQGRELRGLNVRTWNWQSQSGDLGSSLNVSLAFFFDAGIGDFFLICWELHDF